MTGSATALELGSVAVRSIGFGKRTGIDAGVLEVDREGLARELRERCPGLRSVRLHLAEPGESCRIVGVKDVLEPRVEVAGQGGGGRVRALAGMAVVTCGRIVGFQEGIVDLAGEGARYSPFSRLRLLVVECEPEPDLPPHDHEAAVRTAGLAAAELLARAAADAEPDTVERFANDPETARGLPRIAYVYMMLTQGLLHDTWLLGRNAREVLPRTLDPAVVLAGGVVSGNCVSACDKNTTWHHQHNPIVHELFRRHGRELCFAGAVATPAPTRLAEKEDAAARAVALVQELEVAGAVVSKEGFGNPDADLMLLIRGLEAAGVRTVALTDEFAGANGASQSLADVTPEADAVVSVGNANERVVLPPVARTLGPLEQVSVLAGGHARSVRDDGSIEVELQALIGATNQLGEGTLSCRET